MWGDLVTTNEVLDVEDMEGWFIGTAWTSLGLYYDGSKSVWNGFENLHGNALGHHL